MTLFRKDGDHGALFDISGVIPTGATWQEDIYFSEDGAAIDISAYTWRLTLRCHPSQTSADVTFSTETGELVVAADENGVQRILRINVEADTLSGRTGDYIIDIASKDRSDAVQLWGHGVVTLQPNPVSFT